MSVGLFPARDTTGIELHQEKLPQQDIPTPQQHQNKVKKVSGEENDLATSTIIGAKNSILK